IVPVMAIPVVLGGADPESLAKTALVLFVTVLLSLIIGMLASTLCRKTWIAVGLAVLFLGLLVVGVPVAAAVLRFVQVSSAAAWLELLSPAYSLSTARPSAAMLSINHFWL